MNYYHYYKMKEFDIAINDPPRFFVIFTRICLTRYMGTKFVRSPRNSQRIKIWYDFEGTFFCLSLREKYAMSCDQDP